MSIWYNSKKQEYASDGKNGWIKAYCDKVIEELKEALANHVKGTIGRHKAADVDYDSQNTVEDEIKQIYEELADEVSARVTEDTALDTKKADKKTSTNGFIGGNNASETGGGGAIGSGASTTSGGAVGSGAKSGSGFSGGSNAKSGTSSGAAIDCIQLGTGTNSTAKTMQVYSKRITESDGSLTDVGKLSSLKTASKSNIVGAINELKTKDDTLSGDITDLNSALALKANQQNANGGFNGGSESSAAQGGAVGYSTTANNGFAGGNLATTYNGSATGASATSRYGGAAGANSYTYHGGAVGSGAKSGSGFSGGNNAAVKNNGTDSSPSYIDAIQLGTGTNNTPKTLQEYDMCIVNANGSLTDVGMLSDLITSDKTSIVQAVNELARKHKTSEGKYELYVDGDDYNYDNFHETGTYVFNYYTESYGDYESEYSYTEILEVITSNSSFPKTIVQILHEKDRVISTRFGIDEGEAVIWQNWCAGAMIDDAYTTAGRAWSSDKITKEINKSKTSPMDTAVLYGSASASISCTSEEYSSTTALYEFTVPKITVTDKVCGSFELSQHSCETTFSVEDNGKEFAVFFAYELDGDNVSYFDVESREYSSARLSTVRTKSDGKRRIELYLGKISVNISEGLVAPEGGTPNCTDNSVLTLNTSTNFEFQTLGGETVSLIEKLCREVDDLKGQLAD